MPARHAVYEDEKHSPSTSCLSVGERKKQTNLAHVIGAGLEIHHGGTQESDLAQPHNAGDNLPKEGNIARLSVLSEQMMNAPMRLRQVGDMCSLSFLTEPLGL